MQKGKDLYKEKCRTWAEQHFDMHQCFEEYIHLYKEIVSQVTANYFFFGSKLICYQIPTNIQSC